MGNLPLPVDLTQYAGTAKASPALGDHHFVKPGDVFLWRKADKALLGHIAPARTAGEALLHVGYEIREGPAFPVVRSHKYAVRRKVAQIAIAVSVGGGLMKVIEQPVNCTALVVSSNAGARRHEYGECKHQPCQVAPERSVHGWGPVGGLV